MKDGADGWPPVYTPPVPGDLDCDGDIDIQDWLIFFAMIVEYNRSNGGVDFDALSSGDQRQFIVNYFNFFWASVNLRNIVAPGWNPCAALVAGPPTDLQRVGETCANSFWAFDSLHHGATGAPPKEYDGLNPPGGCDPPAVPTSDPPYPVPESPYCSDTLDGAGGCGYFPGSTPPSPSNPDVATCASGNACSDPVLPEDMNLPPNQFDAFPNACFGATGSCPDSMKDPALVIPPQLEPAKLKDRNDEVCSGSGVCSLPDTTDRETQKEQKPQPGGIYNPAPEPKHEEKAPLIMCGETSATDEGAPENAPNQTSTTAERGDCGSGDHPKTGAPVDTIYGYKYEEATDLVVALPGRDFVLTREYSSKPGWADRPSLFGFGWFSPMMMQIVPRAISSDAAAELQLMGAVGDGTIRFYRDTSTSWKPNGPSESVIVSTTHDSVPVYELRNPGRGVVRFYRTTGHMAGLVRNMADQHDNVWTFVYQEFGQSTWTRSRLRTIFLNGTNDSNAQARVDFGYYVPYEVSSSSSLQKVNGNVSRVYVSRYQMVGESREAQVTQMVEYTYKWDKDPFSKDVGTAGDLIQVVRHVRTDRAPSTYKTLSRFPGAGDYDPYISYVTQYRYYHNTNIVRCFSMAPGDERLGDTETILGGQHQLKAVFRSEQLEYYAEKYHESTVLNGGRAYAVRDAAYRLMLLGDDWKAIKAPTGSPPIRVIDLAAKVIQYSQLEDHDGKVSVQYLQSGCGCSGSSQAIRQSFLWIARPSANSFSTQVVESRLTGINTWTPYRTLLYEASPPATGLPPYGKYFVVESIESTPKRWITQYNYDSRGNLTETITPAAFASSQSFTPGTLSSEPSATADSGTTGLVRYSVYNSDNRLIESGVKPGPSGTAQKMVAVTYPGDGANTRHYLPSRVERFSSLSSGANNVETTTLAYTFYGDSSTSTSIKSVKMTVEAELVSENGPEGEGEDPVEYSRYAFLDEAGQLIWSVDALGVPTKREYDAATGRTTKMVVNAADFPSSTFPGPTVSSNTDGEAVTETTVDLLGRVTAYTWKDPAGDPVGVQFSYETRPIDRVRLATTGDDVVFRRSGAVYAAVTRIPHQLPGDTYTAPLITEYVTAGGDIAARTEVNLDGLSDWTEVDGLSASALSGRLLGQYVSKHSHTGLILSETSWHDASGSTGRDESDRRYTWTYTYDELGRLAKEASPSGTLSAYEYDLFGRATEVKVGTTDGNLRSVGQYFYDGAAGSASHGVGNGNLTLVRRKAEDSSSTWRDTSRLHDWRDRLVGINAPLPPHARFDYDNLNRIVAEALFDSTSATSISTTSGRGTLFRTYYSQRGRPYRSEKAIDAGQSSPDFIESNTWFDAAGRTIAETSPDSPKVKRLRDALGRPISVHVTDAGGDAAPGTSGNWEDSSDLSGDTVLEQTEFSYNTTSNQQLSLVRHRQMLHDASLAGGSLTNSSSVRTLTGYLYDEANRPIRTIEFGTNETTTDLFKNGSDPTWPPSGGTIPDYDSSGYESTIVSATTYGPRGLIEIVTDSIGRKTRFEYDDLERTIATVENWTDTSLSIVWDTSLNRWAVTGGMTTGSEDHDRVTSTSYFFEDSTNKPIVRLAAHHPPKTVGSQSYDAQVTDYVYGVTRPGSPGTGDSLLDSFDMLSQVRFPHRDTGVPTDTSDYTLSYAYNLAGEVRRVTDQNGTAHDYTIDKRGRVTIDQATASSGVDSTVEAITRTYGDFGEILSVQSLDGSDAVLNEIEYGYTTLWQLKTLDQDVDSAVSTTSTSGHVSRRVSYSYDTAGMDRNNSSDIGNRSRLESLTYPAFWTTIDSASLGLTRLDYGYSVGRLADVNHRIGRPTALNIVQWDVMTGLVEYSFMGHSTPVKVDYVASDVLLDRTQDASGIRDLGDSAGPQSNGSSGRYPGWDRFGRIKRHAWLTGNSDQNPTTSLPYGREYTAQTFSYDRASNTLTKRESFTGVDSLTNSVMHDWAFEHDGLDRLRLARRGKKVTNTGFSNEGTLWSGSMSWSLDALGNWTSFAKDANTPSSTAGNATPDFTTSGESQARTHNFANELKAVAAGAGQPASTLSQDKNGNRTTWGAPDGTANGVQFKAIYDAWNRLVEIQRRQLSSTGSAEGSTYSAIAKYTYNGLSWRITKQVDARDPTGGATGVAGTLANGEACVGLNQERVFTYDAAWRAIGEEVNDDLGSGKDIGVDRWVQQFFGLRGPNDVVMRRESRGHPEIPDDPGTTEEDESVEATPPDNEYELGWYQLADSQGSVVTLIPFGGRKVVERARFGPYGTCERLLLGDINMSGGAATVQDLFDFLGLYPVKNPAADQNFSGPSGSPAAAITVQDQFDFLADWFGSNNAGFAVQMDRPGRQYHWVDAPDAPDNPYGYCGYYFDHETANARVLGANQGGLYQVRHRVYDPQAGRWLTRDPAGFVDGLNLYEYCAGMPVDFWDPLGLARDWLDRAVDFCAGVSDSLSFGATNWIREKTGLNDTVDRESTSYTVGEVTETVGEVVLTGGLAAVAKKGAAKIAKKAVTEAAENKLAKEAEEQLFRAAEKEVGDQIVKKPRNPHGSKGKPDHQAKVDELERKAYQEKGDGESVLREKKIKGHPGSNRNPDVQIVDQKGKARKVFEAERRPNSKRHRNRTKEYDDLGIDHETHPVP